MIADTAAATVAPPPVAPPPASGDNYSAQHGCFEGPEKLLEIWFAPSPFKLPHKPYIPGDELPPSPNGTDTELSEPTSPNGSFMDYVDFKVNRSRNQHGTGLRVVPKPIWDEMLSIVKCTVLSVIKSTQVDAYLLRKRSSFRREHPMTTNHAYRPLSFASLSLASVLTNLCARKNTTCAQ
ncbi:hypothetical protein BC938DRAFT_472451 [Jimgerdemannia flammicorona]|uniref:Uncharacterized protein n=1 Tax=Jimgerdemannia flammicorona TaxID=994334 RepID=A0A433Q640_9FUNG|nr:hypothetical protein BC938DRAFT_472451 [Jimgerdemannia flammicorona]